MIDTDRQLAEWLPQLRAAPWLALDTEADSLHAYPEKICLLQLSLPGHDLLIDPLGELDLVPLLDLFRDHELLMHGSDYDLRLLRKHHSYKAGKLFDTMIAARLLGVAEFGLGNLVEKFIGVKLEKGSQKANWARRPLTPKMEEYARNDTHHLKPLVDLLRAELIRLGRLEWHAESCARLVEECASAPPPREEHAWRIKGTARLERHAQAVLREIWNWREEQALAANRPPFHVISAEWMFDLANAAVEHRGQVRLPHFLSMARATGLRAAIARGYDLPATQWPENPRPIGRRLTDAQMKRSDAIRGIRDRHAMELGIDPTLIASKSTLLDLAHDWDAAAAGLMSWQLKLVQGAL